MLHLCSFADGTGGAAFAPSTTEGRRKGSAPLGDAWLLEDAIWKSTPENFRYACIASASLRHLRGVAEVSPATSNTPGYTTARPSLLRSLSQTHIAYAHLVSLGRAAGARSRHRFGWEICRRAVLLASGRRISCEMVGRPDGAQHGVHLRAGCFRSSLFGNCMG